MQNEAESGSAPLDQTEIVHLGDEPILTTRFDPKRFQAETARTLAYILIGVLAGSFVLQLAGVVILQALGLKSAAESLTITFNTWLPAISGLAGSAVGYFISRDK